VIEVNTARHDSPFIINIAKSSAQGTHNTIQTEFSCIINA